MAETQPLSLFDETFPAALDILPVNRKESIAQVWPISVSTYAHKTSENYDKEAVAAFFSHLKHEVSSVRNYQGKFAAETLEAHINIIQALKNARAKPLGEIIPEVSKDYFNFDEEKMQRSLELAVRLAFTINVNSPSLTVARYVPLENPMLWKRNVTLDDLVRTRWKKATAGTTAGEQLDHRLTAAHLVKCCGMTLQWTEYLSDHLAVDHRQKILTVYKYKVYLSRSLESQDESCVPNDVLQEALDTLTLLFPFGDKATERLLARHGEIGRGLLEVGSHESSRDLSIGRYWYWREELGALINIFEGPPRTWWHVATDQRNLKDFALFWLTVMGAVFTLIGIPCLIIQTTYGVRAYNVALAQLDG